MKLVTEYLIIIEKKTSEALFRLCNSIEAFNKFLQTEPDIRVTKGHIQYKDHFTFTYELQTGEVGGKEQRYFYVKLGSSGEEEVLTQFVDLNRVIKGLVHQSGGQPETLWNDVSLFYSEQSYPYIHRIENLMRKLITYFMLTTVGKEWISEASPSAVKEVIDKSKRKQQYFDVLYQVDFIHLGDFLFREYQTRSISELYDKLDNVKDLNEFSLEELRSFRARSNWDRYFSGIVECEGAYLDKRWKQLYDLRCMVAHNTLIGREQYDQIRQLFVEVAGPLQKALENLDQVHIPDEDKEQIAENVVSNISASYGDFILLWKSFESILTQIATDIDLDTETRRIPPQQILEAIFNSDIIDEELLKEGQELVQFRNLIVHDASVPIDEREIGNYIGRLSDLVRILKAVLKPVSFHDECILRVEKYLGQPFSKRTRTTYISNDGEIALTCVVSKAYERNNQLYYWFGFHHHHRQFLEQSRECYAAFGCGSEDEVVLIPLDQLSKYLSHMSVTDRNNRYYWHIHIVKDADNLLLQLTGAKPVNLSKFVLSN